VTSGYCYLQRCLTVTFTGCMTADGCAVVAVKKPFSDGDLWAA